jgi:FkbH-like protein
LRTSCKNVLPAFDLLIHLKIFDISSEEVAMTIASHQPMEKSQGKQAQMIAMAATFTAEPAEDSLMFWMKELEISAEIEFAPYNQVFQQLLDPSSLLSQNQHGVNVVLLRFEDWQRFVADDNEQINAAEQLERNLKDLVMGLRTAIARSSTPYLLCLCPASPKVKSNAAQVACFQSLEERLVAEVSGLPGLHLVREQDFALYPVADYYDAQRDQLGHIPFTSLFFTALGAVLSRKIYALKSPPHKVIVMDCDNTIWKGVVGEDGVMGIEIPPAWQQLQEFMLTQQQAGMVLCLCSKNIEADVMEVFEQRADMTLKLEHLVAWRVNWLPKSENLKSLAAELNLGLDSFIFIDDNPVECAEVQAACPDVLVLQLPIKDDIPKFLNHVWAFDHMKVTEEDKQRTVLYKQNVERNRLQQDALSIEDFLASLGLEIKIAEPTPEQLSRVAQLTQRTNQFNFTTIRRSEVEIQQLAQVGLECRVVEVRDRFGDYGLVGVMIFGPEAAAINIDTFLLSCRVLGRGVEHRMLNYVGEVARERNVTWVKAPFSPTPKNLPALNFLDGVGADFKQPAENGACFCFPTETAATVTSQAGHSTPAIAGETSKKTSTVAPTTARLSKSTRLTRIATELVELPQVLHQIESQVRTMRSLAQPIVLPRNETEQRLVSIWRKLLRLETVGVQDNYFDLDGTSLLTVELFVQIENAFGRKLPLTTILAAPTIAELAKLLEQSAEETTPESCLVRLHQGAADPPLFLVHDGDGETLLYRNLAQHLTPSRTVYGLQPLSREGVSMMHTRISEMATYYIEQIQTVQPEGPYLLGGMCAGGVIAFEIACQLQKQGQQIAFVGLIDAADVAASKRSVASQRLNRFSSALSQDQQAGPVAQWVTTGKKIFSKVVNTLVYEVGNRYKIFQDTRKMRSFQIALDQGKVLPKSLQNIPVRTVYLFAEQRYTPTDLFDGEVTLLRATVAGEGPDEPYVNVYSDPLFGWNQRVTKGVKVYDIPGGHSSMLQEPNAQVLAEKMQAYIQASLVDKTLLERSPTPVSH